MEANHECFHDVHLARHRLQLFGLRSSQRQRLFAQHMLTRLRCPQCPWHVLIVGQRVVDHLDGRIGQQLLVRAIGAGNTQALGNGARLV